MPIFRHEKRLAADSCGSGPSAHLHAYDTSRRSVMSRVATPSSPLFPIVAKAPVSIIGAETLLGSPVMDRDGRRIGGLRDLMVDMRHGRIAYGLVALDDAPAWSGRLIAVPWNAMHADGDGNLKVNARRDWVERGPSIPAG